MLAGNDDDAITDQVEENGLIQSESSRNEGMREKGGKPGAIGYRRNEFPGRPKPGKDRQQKPNTYDATSSNEEDDKTVQHPDLEFFWLKKSPFNGVINKPDRNLDYRDHEHEAEACCGKSDQKLNEEENVSANQDDPNQQQQLQQDDPNQQQQLQQDDPNQQQQLQQQLPRSTPQMIIESMSAQDGVINKTDRNLDYRDHEHEAEACCGKSDQKLNEEENVSANQDNRGRGKRGKDGRSGACGYGKNEHPGRAKSGKDRQQKPNTYDATYSDEEDDKTVQHPDFEFFWLKKSPFSQWYARKFSVGDRTFVTAEQFMVYQKAVIYQDYETAGKILNEKNPREQQKLGRQAKNFSSQKWKEVCLEIVKTANMSKFSQNEDLKNHLFSTYPKNLVEASPFDRIWGIGRAASDPKAQTKETWLGYNLLGYALTDVRNEMMIKEGLIPMDAQTLLAECALIDIKDFDEVEGFV